MLILAIIGRLQLIFRLIKDNGREKVFNTPRSLATCNRIYSKVCGKIQQLIDNSANLYFDFLHNNIIIKIDKKNRAVHTLCTHTTQLKNSRTS